MARAACISGGCTPGTAQAVGAKDGHGLLHREVKVVLEVFDRWGVSCTIGSQCSDSFMQPSVSVCEWQLLTLKKASLMSGHHVNQKHVQ